MAGRRVMRPAVVRGVEAVTVEDTTVDRAISVVRDAVSELQADRKRYTTTVSLTIGTNRIRHGLGRDCFGCVVTPTVASAAFAYAIDLTNPRPDLELWLTVVGTDQPNARVEVM